MRKGVPPLAVDTADIVRLGDLEGWTWQKIALEVGMTTSGVRSRYLRRSSLDEVVKHHGGQPDARVIGRRTGQPVKRLRPDRWHGQTERYLEGDPRHLR